MSASNDDDSSFDDPELLAAMAAAFGEPDDAKRDDHAASEGETLSDLIERLESSMATIGGAAAKSSESSDASARIEEERFVVFEIANRRAGLPLKCTREIERIPSYTKLPRTPQWLCGIANIRGQIISITDLASLVDQRNEPTQPGQKIIVVHSEQRSATTAIVVDRIIGIRSYTDRLIPCPTDLTDPLAGLADRAARTADGPVLLLHPLRLFDHPAMQPFMNAG